jgi:hypothetical protein
MGTEVKFFHSDMVGAPVLSGTVGALITVLDACLLSGFGLVTPTSIVVASNIATVTLALGHAFVANSVALIAGATPAGLNGEKRLLSVTTTSATFATAGITDQTATGTLTIKLSPLGWAKTFTGTNLAAYKPADVAATGMLLRVNDTTTTVARIVAYESMSDVNTGLAPFPTAAQVSGGLYWNKSYQANATARQWIVFGDSRAFYFCAAPQAAASFVAHFFGDIAAYKSGDAYSCALAGSPSDRTNDTSAAFLECMGSTTATAGVSHYFPRAHTTLGSSVGHAKFAMAHWADSPGIAYSGTAGMVSTNRVMPYPNGPDNALVFSKVLSWSQAGLRGSFPGMYHSPQNCQTAFVYKDLIAGTGELAGKTVMAMPVGNATKTSYGLCFLDLTGPWR